MKEIVGLVNKAIVYTDVIEETAVEQIQTLCNQEFVRNSKIRIMPDVHAGMGCTIGFTMNVTDKVCANLVGVDIGCGMAVIPLGNVNIDLAELDNVIRKYIPYGRDVHSSTQVKYNGIKELRCFRELKDTPRLEKSIGSLGGGNHFIEVDIDDEGNKFLVIHSGSRNLGHQVASYYQKLAIDLCSGKDKMFEEKENIIETYKSQGKRNEIQAALKQVELKYKNAYPDIPEGLCYLTGKYKDNYLHDMQICQEFASLNRATMAQIITTHMRLDSIDGGFNTIHNYINFTDNILRKGAISAYEGEVLIIPINMRDGCIISKGKGNADWNYSAPHGAGRLMSRAKARETLNLNEFQASMSDVFTTSVGIETLDEAPMAYKNIDDIINNIGDTVEIIKIIKPIYNFKASE